jgi:hypothetical protein
MISLKDMYDDQVLSRQVKRAEQRANREYDDDEDEDDMPRGTQRRRPEEIEDESGFLERGESARKKGERFKRERMSRGGEEGEEESE